MKSRLTTSIALLILIGSTSASAEEQTKSEVVVCKPGSAIRRTLDDETDLAQVRRAPAHGSCRNTATPERSDLVVPANSGQFAQTSFTICKPGSAIRYRVSQMPDSRQIRVANSHGSCRF